jgi:F0F1-type ATP synthase assembly protein I
MTTSEGVALSPTTDRGVDLMLAVAIQFVVAIAVWGGIGLVLDLLLPTAPWLQFIGIMLGTAVGLVLAQRRAVPPPSNGDRHG